MLVSYGENGKELIYDVVRYLVVHQSSVNAWNVVIENGKLDSIQNRVSIDNVDIVKVV